MLGRFRGLLPIFRRSRRKLHQHRIRSRPMGTARNKWNFKWLY
nr:MAG TPA: hypothetical protein [Caudoviricetes sp.]